MMLREFMSRFARDDRGSATIESLLWFPIFIYLLLLITDVSFIFYGKAQALRIVQDGNRSRSIEFLPSDTAASAFITAELQRYDPTAVARTAYDPLTGLISTEASLSASELMVIGAIPGFGDFRFEIVAKHFKEQ